MAARTMTTSAAAHTMSTTTSAAAAAASTAHANDASSLTRPLRLPRFALQPGPRKMFIGELLLAGSMNTEPAADASMALPLSGSTDGANHRTSSSGSSSASGTSNTSTNRSRHVWLKGVVIDMSWDVADTPSSTTTTSTNDKTTDNNKTSANVHTNSPPFSLLLDDTTGLVRVDLTKLLTIRRPYLAHIHATLRKGHMLSVIGRFDPVSRRMVATHVVMAASDDGASAQVDDQESLWMVEVMHVGWRQRGQRALVV